jgi:signal transduction histidine kinase/CheY-like chemotaxis protein
VEKATSTFTTEKDELWLANSDGIFQIDTANFSIIQHILSEKRGTIWSFLKDEKGRWWAGSRTKGLLIKEENNNSLVFYRKSNEFSTIESSRIVHLKEDGEYLWAISNTGLYLIQYENGVIQRYWSNAEADYRLPLDDVHHLHKDKNGVFWAATNADGLVRFELDSELKVKNIKQYTINDNLSSNVLYAILEDGKERLWISTLNGISCLDKQTEEIQVFNQEDGLSQLEFNRISYFQTKDGKIYFGTIRGVIGFYPDQVIKSEPYQSPIYISDFSLYDGKLQKIVNRTSELSKKQKIVLQPNDRFFRLSVSMVDYFNANQLTYSYQIKGLFKDFQKIKDNVIEISGLPYGKYTLTVRGQSTDRRYSTEELSIPLVVVRPFYLRWWFILFGIIIMILSALQFYYWRVRKLNERKHELELLVQERTLQIQEDKAIIEEQAEQLKELDELKSKFFANISHELRTPLTLILAPLEGVLKRNKQNNRDFTSLQLMQQNGKKLLKRINELLDLSRLDANKLEVNRAPTFLYPFLKIVLSTFESAANLKDIHLLFDYDLNEEIQMMLDTDKVEKIVSNYLSNALKFTPKGGNIKLNVKKDGNQLRLSVSDTGIGILPEDLDNVFERFYQTKTSKDFVRENSSGIGLSLCKELAKVLDGKVWVTSEIGSGSVFYIQIPLVETFATKENASIFVSQQEEILPFTKPEMITSFDAKKSTILVVEDNIDLRNYISILLESTYNVLAVENGKEALEQLTANETLTKYRQPSLILSDIMMPVMDGIELLKAVKADDNLRHIPMVMLTARQNLDVKLEVLRIGVDDYLTKPFKEEELLVRIDNLITNSKNRQPIEAEVIKEEKIISAADTKWLSEVEAIFIKYISSPKFKLSMAADMLNMSQRRMQQKIKAITGLSPKQYQRSIKLAKAREILKSGDVQTVTEVMYQIGLDNHHYFSKMYKAEFGIMPSEEL